MKKQEQPKKDVRGLGLESSVERKGRRVSSGVSKEPELQHKASKANAEANAVWKIPSELCPVRREGEWVIICISAATVLNQKNKTKKTKNQKA